MYTILAAEKSEYSKALHTFLNLKLKPKERYAAFRIMQELEESVREAGDDLEIIITSKNTPRPLDTAPPMISE